MAQEYVIIIVCCVCKKKLGEKPTPRPDQHMMESHTYCEPCMQAAMEEIEKS